MSAVNSASTTTRPDVLFKRCDMPLSLRDACVAAAREALVAHKVRLG